MPTKGTLASSSHLFLAKQRLSVTFRQAEQDYQPFYALQPFSVSNNHSGQNIIGHLLAHEIIACLSREKEFEVISRLSTRAFCGHSARLSDIGARLGADYVLWGNCEVRRDCLSVRFELANTGSQTVIWAGSQGAPLSAVREGYAGLDAVSGKNARPATRSHHCRGRAVGA